MVQWHSVKDESGQHRSWIGCRLVYCDEITDETHEVIETPRDDGLLEVSLRRRSKWERFKRRFGLAA